MGGFTGIQQFVQRYILTRMVSSDGFCFNLAHRDQDPADMTSTFFGGFYIYIALCFCRCCFFFQVLYIDWWYLLLSVTVFRFGVGFLISTSVAIKLRSAVRVGNAIYPFRCVTQAPQPRRGRLYILVLGSASFHAVSRRQRSAMHGISLFKASGACAVFLSRLRLPCRVNHG